VDEDEDSDFEEEHEQYLQSKKTQLHPYYRRKLERLLRSLTSYRSEIAHFMVYAMIHSYAAEEIVDMVCQSLLIPETKLWPEKIGRLYLVSDLLHNRYTFSRR
jgi:U2-associated protein SR140